MRVVEDSGSFLLGVHLDGPWGRAVLTGEAVDDAARFSKASAAGRRAWVNRNLDLIQTIVDRLVTAGRIEDISFGGRTVRGYLIRTEDLNPS
jgi:hypothetical protein